MVNGLRKKWDVHLGQDMSALMISSCEDMMNRLRQSEGKVVDMDKEFTLLTSDVISKAAFGSNYREGREIFETLDKLAVLTQRNRWIPGMR